MIGPALLAAAGAAAAEAGRYAGEAVNRAMGGGQDQTELAWAHATSMVAANLAVQEALLRAAAKEPDLEKQRQMVEQALLVARESRDILAKAPEPKAPREARALTAARSALAALLKTGADVAKGAAAGLSMTVLVAAIGVGVGLMLMRGGDR